MAAVATDGLFMQARVLSTPGYIAATEHTLLTATAKCLPDIPTAGMVFMLFLAEEGHQPYMICSFSMYKQSCVFKDLYTLACGFA